MNDDPVVVVGAGLAGLAAAVRLAAAGRAVRVVEAREEPGGCCGTARVGPYRFDTGPSVLTMPGVLADLLGTAGEELDAHLPLRRLDPYYRIAYHDGAHLDVVAGEDAMADRVAELCGPEEALRYRRFRRHLGAMFDAAWPVFINADTTRLRSMARPAALLRLARLGGFRRLDRLAAAFLTDDRLIRAHTFQALYVGLPPQRALGVYAVIAHMDTVGGVYFPEEGGMHAIPRALAAVAGKHGARFDYGTRVDHVEADSGGIRGVRLAGGERIAARHVIVTCDLPKALNGLLPPTAADWRNRDPHYSPSCLVMHFGLDRPLPGQAHHTLHLGRQWDETFAALDAGHPQPDPSLLMTHPVGDATAAPPGHTTLSALEPAPNLRGRVDWKRQGAHLQDRLLERLHALGYGDLSSAPRTVLDPLEWERLGHSAGTPFALDHRFTQTAWFRPTGAPRRVPGLHLAGMHTAPGVGVPPVLISGRLAAERVLESAR